MALMDDLGKQAGDVAGWVASHPQAVTAVVAMLSTRDRSVGGGSGLASLVDAFQRKGLGDMIGSWISTGPNPPVSPAQLHEVLGSELIGEFASKAGLNSSQAGAALAALLPAVVDHLTPAGEVPHENALESTLGGLLGSLGGR